MSMEFHLQPHHRNVPDQTLLQDLAHVASKLGTRRLTTDQYNDHGQYNACTIRRRFGSWFKALELAGLEKTRNLDIPTDDLFANLAEVWLKLGRQPRYVDIEGEVSRFSAGTYEYRFGTWRKALEAFVRWANAGTSTSDEPSPPSERKALSHRTSRSANWRQRALVLMRDGATCRMCGARPEHGARLHVDHVVPWSKGGETVIENLQILCEQCNVGKSDADLSDQA